MTLDLTRIRALCFDVDGTLSDTDDLYVQKVQRFLPRFLFRDPSRAARRFVMWAEAPGNGWREAGTTRSSPLPGRDPASILNHMVQFSKAHVDAAFGALSDPTRRGVLEQLGRGDASISVLAERFQMTLTGMKKHVSVLEQAGLVTTQKVGRVRTCRLGKRRLSEEAAWLERYRQRWAARFDELDDVLEELKEKEKNA